jgi:hypothetical protein
MKSSAAVLILSACVTMSQCDDSDFHQPLSPAEDSVVDPNLLGAWGCPGEPGEPPSTVTFLDFDGRQYYVEFSAAGSKEAWRNRAIATDMTGVVFLSMQEIGTSRSEHWTMVEYLLPDSEHLTVRGIDFNQFYDIRDDPAAVRQRLEAMRQDPALYLGEQTCSKVKEKA